MKRGLRKLIIFTIVLLQANYLYFIKIPALIPGESASFTNASDTLSNARISYNAGVASGASTSSVVTIDSTGNADNNTNHLFPSDDVCFTNAAQSGCIDNKTYRVANIINTTTFNIDSPLTTGLDTSGFAIASQSAIHTIAFTLSNSVPTSGDILITIPAVNTTGKTNDNFPDTANTVAENGFDLGGVGTGNISVGSTVCNNNWTVATVTAGTAGTDHTILINRHTDSCAAGSTITVTIGDTSKKMINPAPANDSGTPNHTQGVADVYTINVKTRDGGDNTLDSSNLKTAVVEGVLVSATVQETLSLTIGAVPSATSVCGLSTDVTTTATAVPWGTISNFGTFMEAAQTVTVSTNAGSGYNVKVDENDQMGKDGGVCTGPSAGEANDCIQDTTCNTACTEASSDEWTTATKYGLGYSLANVSGTDAAFLYNESARTFSAKQFADQETTGPTEDKQIIMQNAGPVAASQAYMCYRLNVSATQPAGYYYNKVRYTATASF